MDWQQKHSNALSNSTNKYWDNENKKLLCPLPGGTIICNSALIERIVEQSGKKLKYEGASYSR